MYYLYCYTSPSGKKYVGITDCISRRQQEHAKKERGCKGDKSKFAQAIRKYGYNNFTFDIIGTSSERENIEDFEQYFIDLLDTINNGYNITTGGRYGKGSKKFDKETLLKIDADLQSGNYSYTELTQLYGISPAMLNKIKNRTAWADILGNKVERTNKYKKGSQNPAAKLTEEKVKEIRQALADGIKRKELQQKYNVSKSLIQAIATNKFWIK